jgi:hypothetical protein
MRIAQSASDSTAHEQLFSALVKSIFPPLFKSMVVRLDFRKDDLSAILSPMLKDPASGMEVYTLYTSHFKGRISSCTKITNKLQCCSTGKH